MAVKREKSAPKKYIVPAVEQVLRILFTLFHSDSSHMSLIEISKQAGIHKSNGIGGIGGRPLVLQFNNQ